MTERFQDKLACSAHPWMTATGLVRLWDLLESHGIEARVVGGAIRSALLGQAVQDIDLAVNRPPDIVSDLLYKAGFKVIPTGYDHGTIMAVADGKGYEITSLRRDVKTDGRHAEVVFTDNWAEDAARRDFTVNALYMDRSGRIYDYFDGLGDLAGRRVRFVGEAEARIREDVLRILRYFRFMAQIGGAQASSVDMVSIKACRVLAPLMISLSGERIWREISRWLVCPDPLPSLRLAYGNDIFKTILPELDNLDALQRMLPVEVRLDAPNAVRRLAVMWQGQAEALASRLRFSRLETNRLETLLSLRAKVASSMDEATFRQLIYDLGSEAAQDYLILALADGQEGKEPLTHTLGTWENPVFPLKGKDILAMGYNQGPTVGALLAEVENWWRAADFRPDKQACLDQARHKVSGG